MLAALDLGTNSFHLLIAEFVDGQYSVVKRFSEKVQLGEGVFIKRNINEAAFQRGMDCLKAFREHIDRFPVNETRIIGTQTLRYADNAEDFISSAKDLGFNIEVVTGEREAFLIYKGVNRIIDDIRLPRLIIDIGGGSTELSVGADISPSALTSIPIGCISWRDTFFGKGEVSAPAIDEAIAEATKAIARGSQPIQSENWQKVFASSGSAKVLSSVLRENQITDGTITQDGLQFVLDRALSAKHVDSLELPGLKPHRRNLITPGTCIMRALMESLSLEEIHLSPAALREGLLETSRTAYEASHN